MIRKIIKIDREKCNGCGACAAACHEGAIAMVDEKAQLMRDDYCDGLGDCLPACPTGAITFEQREADAYNAEAVAARQKRKTGDKHPEVPQAQHCPGSLPKRIVRKTGSDDKPMPCTGDSQLGNWPVQIKLAPVKAPYFDGARLLVAADCTAYACGTFHQDFIKDRVTLIGCPKLDSVDYTDKLAAIIKGNAIKEVLVARMEVPCCGGLEQAVKNALIASGKMIPWQVIVLATDGSVVQR